MKHDRMAAMLIFVTVLAILVSLSSSVPLIPGMEEDPVKYQMEVYVICDKYCLKNIGNPTSTKAAVLQTFNNTAQIMRQLGVEVVVVGIEIWNKYSWVNLTGSSSVLFDWTASKIGYYLNKTYFDDIIFMTGMVLEDNGFRGRHGQGCMGNSWCNGVIYVPSNPNVMNVATSVAHEIGHGIGMDHDDNACDLGQYKCIMTSVWSPNIVRNPVYSTRSKSTMATFLNSTRSYAMRKPVAPAVVQVAGVQCGNGIVERGEECDCGTSCLPDGCCNCCRNCKLVKGAQCAAGKCCNSKTCKFKASKTLCRKKRDDSCDSDDFCDGKSSECKNTKSDDWTDCTDFAGQTGYCQGGFCNTISVQCRFVWDQDYRAAAENCYVADNGGKDKSKDGNADYKCKALICAGNNNNNGLNTNRNPKRTKTSNNEECLVGRYLEVERAYLGLSGTMMVEDGTKCGTGRACYAGKCVSKNDAVAQITRKPVFTRSGYCGNGRIEHGEDCDCGAQQCSCCNPNTCKFQPKDFPCLESCGLCSGRSENCPATNGSSISDYKQCGGDFNSMCYNGSCVNLAFTCQNHFSLSLPAMDLAAANANQSTLTANAGGFVAYVNNNSVHEEFRKGEDDGVCGIVKCRSVVDSTGSFNRIDSNGNRSPCPVKVFQASSVQTDLVLYHQCDAPKQIVLERIGRSEVTISYPLLTYDGVPCKLAAGNDGYCRTYSTKSTKYPSIDYYYSKCTKIPTTPTNSRYQFNKFNN